MRVLELARALGWEKSRLSHQLTRMQQRGLVERSNCSEDRRGAFVVVGGPWATVNLIQSFAGTSARR